MLFNLIISFSIGKWLVPPSPPRPKTLTQKIKDSMPHQFSMVYWRNNRQFVGFLFFLIVANIILFVHRAYYFRNFSTLSGETPNGFYMMSRANGKQRDIEQNDSEYSKTLHDKVTKQILYTF